MASRLDSIETGFSPWVGDYAAACAVLVVALLSGVSLLAWHPAFATLVVAVGVGFGSKWLLRGEQRENGARVEREAVKAFRQLVVVEKLPVEMKADLVLDGVGNVDLLVGIQGRKCLYLVEIKVHAGLVPAGSGMVRVDKPWWSEQKVFRQLWGQLQAFKAASGFEGFCHLLVWCPTSGRNEVVKHPRKNVHVVNGDARLLWQVLAKLDG